MVGRSTLCLVAACILIMSVRGLCSRSARLTDETVTGADTRSQEGASASLRSSDTAKAAIQCKVYYNLVFVPVRINGSEPCWFVLDSGADAFVIHRKKAQELGLTIKGSSEASGIGDESVKISYAKKVTLSLAGLQFTNKTVAIYPFEFLEQQLGTRLDGVLGCEVFKQYVVEIDYDSQIVRLYDPKSYRYEGPGEAVPITLKDCIPHIKGTLVPAGLAPIDGKYVVDSGGVGAVSLTGPFVKTNDLLKTLTKTYPSRAFGAKGQTEVVNGRVERLQLGRFAMEKPIAAFSKTTKGELARNDAAGIIGGEVWRRFKIIFDYARERVILEPNAHLTEAFVTDASGLSLTGEGPDHNIATVRGVLADSPAAEAGLREGDQIGAIDDKPTSGMSLKQVRDEFKREGQECSLRIKRGDQVITTRIKLRRLL